MDLASLEIVIAIIAQTVVIGFYIGTIKTVVDRLVKDVENIRQDLKEGLKGFYSELVGVKLHVEKIDKEQATHDIRISNLEKKQNHHSLS